MKPIDIEQIIADVRDDVARKRADGSYPVGLEEELEAEFRTILTHGRRGVTDRNAEVSRLIDEIRQAGTEISGLTPVSSKIPGMSLVHRVIRRLIARQTMGLASQVRFLEDRQLQLLRIIADQGKAMEDADTSLAAGLSKHVMDRIAVIDHLSILVTEFETRIKNLEVRNQ